MFLCFDFALRHTLLSLNYLRPRFTIVFLPYHIVVCVVLVILIDDHVHHDLISRTFDDITSLMSVLRKMVVCFNLNEVGFRICSK